jgi:hypothetical protein
MRTCIAGRSIVETLSRNSRTPKAPAHDRRPCQWHHGTSGHGPARAAPTAAAAAGLGLRQTEHSPWHRRSRRQVTVTVCQWTVVIVMGRLRGSPPLAVATGAGPGPEDAASWRAGATFYHHDPRIMMISDRAMRCESSFTLAVTRQYSAFRRTL